jgi:hypothetical protein
MQVPSASPEERPGSRRGRTNGSAAFRSRAAAAEPDPATVALRLPGRSRPTVYPTMGLAIVYGTEAGFYPSIEERACCTRRRAIAGVRLRDRSNRGGSEWSKKGGNRPSGDEATGGRPGSARRSPVLKASGGDCAVAWRRVVRWRRSQMLKLPDSPWRALFRPPDHRNCATRQPERFGKVSRDEVAQQPLPLAPLGRYHRATFVLRRNARGGRA